MTRSWSLRRLFPMMWNGAPEQGAVKKKVSATGVIRFGDFTIDIDERIVTLCGEELPLTSEEFDVLVFLTDHRQRLVTPRTMLATPGMANGVRKTEFLRALISLRKKLDAAGPGQQYLRTEPWVIYRFDPTSSSTASKAVQTATFSTSDNVRCDQDDKEKSGSMDAKDLAQWKLCVGQVTSVGK